MVSMIHLGGWKVMVEGRERAVVRQVDRSPMKTFKLRGAFNQTRFVVQGHQNTHVQHLRIATSYPTMLVHPLYPATPSRTPFPPAPTQHAIPTYKNTRSSTATLTTAGAQHPGSHARSSSHHHDRSHSSAPHPLACISAAVLGS